MTSKTIAQEFDGRIHMAVVLDVRLLATNQADAYAKLKDFERVIRDLEWGAPKASTDVLSVNESSYIVSSAVKNRKQVDVDFRKGVINVEA